ncbi:peptide/nickel transport system substrate-binding protein [Variovorax boronicumulans]|uniref:Peptide/nickel transport system substrate-binding protein n=1 Tax=Variovorax boronicumulans TaxID=436515 RepID=A0AAW8CT39_9BURK|nr:ABC transporter substrate-binding protein [Variovorax boronicumulans]MDP9891064.1 peptide/nickel transport system substrate-binding protein [Variovorax boronicumulans]MDQ0051131.1 peptide/nickel transport system substrate-binding protein [Variovorax boronicumulans]
MLSSLLDRFKFSRRLLHLALAALPFAAVAQTKAPTPVGGGTLTYAVSQEPTSLVSFLDTKTDNRNISAKVTEGLLRYDAKFNPQPLLATSWQVSADGLKYTFKLRPGVKFHDGRDFTAEDVRYSVLTQKKQGPRGRITLANVERVDAPDPLTAVIVLSKPAPFLIKSLSSAELPIVPSHRYADGDPLGSANISAPVGTGPFIFEQWVRGSHLVLRKNPGYWRTGTPRIDRVIVKFIRDPAAISTAIETGEVDVAQGVSLADLERLAANPKLKVDDGYDGFLNNASFLEFNVENPVLANPKVRHAIAQAIDRNFIRNTIYYKRVEVVNSPIPRVLSDYYDDSTFRDTFDVAAANKLLDEAGQPKQANGQRFALRLSYIPGAEFKRTADYLRSALARVSIKVEIVDGDLPTFLKRVYTTRDFDININGLGRLFDPTVGVQRIYWGDGVRNPLIWVNAAHYDNPQVDDLFRQAAVEVDAGKRAAQFKQIQQIVGRELPVLPLVAVPSIVVHSARLHNFHNSIDLMSGDLADAWIEPKK